MKNFEVEHYTTIVLDALDNNYTKNITLCSAVNRADALMWVYELESTREEFLINP